jgi:L-alanine-DL-glutamate epimerase-like enolase superfamily enzyme
MKIREIRAAGLKGATPQGGWSSEPQPQDCIHTLVVVFTDEDVTGVGSVFTNSDLVMLQDYEISWFEEPLKPDAIDDYVLLRRNAPVPISGGEVLTRRQSFDAWLRKGAFDIVQPDVTKVGGISESRRIAWMAQENGIRYIPHGWNTAVGLAADLQLASAFSDTDLVEYITGSPYIDEIAAGGWRLDEDGLLQIPNTPGLGLTLDRDAVAKYTDGDLRL